jgi:hypothetical protein
VGLFQLSLVIFLAEIVEQLRGPVQGGYVDRGGIIVAEPGRGLEINQEDSPQNTVLPHEVLDRANFLCVRIAGTSRQQGHRGTEQPHGAKVHERPAALIDVGHGISFQE